MNNVSVAKETSLTGEKGSVVLVLPYLGSISLQTRTKSKKSLKNILNFCKLQIVFKNKTILDNNFHFKDQIPKDLTSGVNYKFQCGQCNESYYDECTRHLIDWYETLENILVYQYLSKKKFSLRTAP